VAAREQGVAGLLHEAAARSQPADPGLVDALRPIHEAWLARGLQQLALVERTRAILRAGGRRAARAEGRRRRRAPVRHRGRAADVGRRPPGARQLAARSRRSPRPATWRTTARTTRGATACPVPRTLELHRHLTSCGALFPSDAVPMDGPPPPSCSWCSCRCTRPSSTGSRCRSCSTRLPPPARARGGRRGRARARRTSLRAASRWRGRSPRRRRSPRRPDPGRAAPALRRPAAPGARAGGGRTARGPSRRGLARMRWQVARGQRLHLLTATLRSGPVAEDGSAPRTPVLPRLRALLRREPAVLPRTPTRSRTPCCATACRGSIASASPSPGTVCGRAARGRHRGPGAGAVGRRRFGGRGASPPPGGPAAAPADLAPAPACAGAPKGDRAPFCDPALAHADLLATVVASEPARGRVRSAWRALVSLASAVGARLDPRSAW
jgi:hypothetical protein